MNDLIGLNQGGFVTEAGSSYNQKLARMPTVRERCAIAVKEAENRLAKVKEAQDILERNPDLERLLDIMQAAHF